MKRAGEEDRGQTFSDRISTAIWSEETDPRNPFQASEARCHGYRHLSLINNKSYAEVLFLLFRGELPSAGQKVLFEKLLISIINPGPRHNATRAAMSAAVSRTHVSHLLPLALNIFSGDWQGSHAVFDAMKFLSEIPDQDPTAMAKKLSDHPQTTEGDICLAPGFGSLYGTRDYYSQRLADNLSADSGRGVHFRWAQTFVDALPEENSGWLISGVVAACLLDLGFTPYQGEMIYQIGSAPGLAAHGAEKINKPVTDMPFVAESSYVIKDHQD